jgi:PTH1 family peptidyl-tRNA hydrolase
MLTDLFIFGLGNPGLEYKFSRHNFGFIAVDNFAKQNNFPEFANKKNYAASSLFFIKAAKNVHLIKPMTYMNQSGIAVKEVLKKHGVFNIEDTQASDVIVMHDDLDLNFGRIKIKSGGSGGSHNGLISIINSMQSKNFIRLKLGINSDLRNKFKTGADFVLANFAKNEVKQMPEILKTLNDILIAVINEGIVKTMNEFNSLLKN